MSAVQNSLAPPPEFLAESNHPERMVYCGITVSVIITLVYVMFITSRSFFAERNGWEVWAVFPLSYLVCLATCVLTIRKLTPPSPHVQRLTDPQVTRQTGGAGYHVTYWLITDPTTIVRYLKITTAIQFTYYAGVSLPKVCILIFVESV